MKQLIVTGDDFGLSVAVNEAIETAHLQGILTTTSLMVAGEAARDAVDRARRLATLKIGLHLVVIRGRALLPAREIPDLVDARGRFKDDLVRAGFRYFFRPAVRRQLEAEIRAQFEAFLQTGLALDHVNAHNHMHVHPTILNLVIKVGRDFGMTSVRVPYEPPLRSWRAARKGLPRRIGTWLLTTPWTLLMKWRLRRAAIGHNDYIFGMNDTGAMAQGLVLRLLGQLPEGLTEMYFHPASHRWAGMNPATVHYQVENELQALTSRSVADALRAAHIHLAGFRGLPDTG